MSGRHRIVKPRRRYGLTVVAAPARLLWRWVCAGWGRVARTWARLAAKAKERFEARDPFTDVDHDPQAASPDLIASPVDPPAGDADPEPAPMPMLPERALSMLHAYYPQLPALPVRWRVYDRAVVGEVDALKLDEDGQRRVVNTYAAALGVDVVTTQDDDHITVSATSIFCGVTVTVTAVFAHSDTIPLRVYRESVSTQETQALPPEVVEEVLSR